jgi:GNAT superfamily N-acetyltransferase
MEATHDIQVRLARTAEARGVLEVDHVSERADEVRRAIDESRCRVADTGVRIVGFCVEGRFYGFDFLELLVVASIHRRHGVATALMKSWEEAAKTAKLFTSTNESNIPMQRLCERLGYVRSGFIENLDEGDPEIIYFKPNSHPSTSK